MARSALHTPCLTRPFEAPRPQPQILTDGHSPLGGERGEMDRPGPQPPLLLYNRTRSCPKPLYPLELRDKPTLVSPALFGGLSEAPILES